MIKVFLKIILLFIPLVGFSQQNLIEYAVFHSESFKPFKELNITKYTITGYGLNKKEEFKREDKAVYSYESKTGVVTEYFLNLHNRPSVSGYYKEDCLGDFYLSNNDTVNHIYCVKDKFGRIIKTNTDSCIYNEKGNLIKIISLDSAQNNFTSFAFVEEYEYDGDILKSKLTYHINRANIRDTEQLTEYIYENGKLKGYRYSEKNIYNARKPSLCLFELVENDTVVKELVYVNNKLTQYFIIEYGK